MDAAQATNAGIEGKEHCNAIAYIILDIFLGPHRREVPGAGSQQRWGWGDASPAGGEASGVNLARHPTCGLTLAVFVISWWQVFNTVGFSAAGEGS